MEKHWKNGGQQEIIEKVGKHWKNERHNRIFKKIKKQRKNRRGKIMPKSVSGSIKGSMVEGNPTKPLIGFALPMVAGNLFQQFYNIIDSIIVGNVVGEDALAAVGASTAITMLFVMVAIGTGIGCSVVISQLFGAGQLE